MWKSGRHPLSDMLMDCCLRVFGHIACSPPNQESTRQYE